MHWLRIDRYFAIEDTEGGMHTEYKDIDAQNENKKIGNYENVKVVFQPILCQHCSNAPCETVCPVNATNHSTEGLNQQAYNRCVGTRYCANNCPYKVRRFNWFNYAINEQFKDTHFQTDLGRMVLNPDVTVRTRGVMEKCSFCVQRIQLGKLSAKKDGRALKDGEIKTACQQVCPANAIVFGDMNDPNSEVSKLMENRRTYAILTELNTRPAVNYMSKVRYSEETTKA
jgi:molybdopterin-containing oxidoreductase family iron-sulfur binding subunit